MAAHDDEKISDNRRRLFKALSAAPVVMTLRPGEALATASAYQCAEAVRKKAFSPAPFTEGGQQAFGPFSSPNLPDGTNPEGLVAGTDLRWYVNMAGGMLVDGVSCDAGFSPPLAGFAVEFGNKIWHQGADYEGRVELVGAERDVTNNRLVFKNSGGDVCYVVPNGAEGYFAKAIRMNSEDTDVETYVAATYPKRRIRLADPQPTKNQVITATCLCSVDPDNPIYLCPK